MVRVGAAAVVEFEFDIADCVMLLFDVAGIEEFKFVGGVIEVLEFAAFEDEALITIDPAEITLVNFPPNAFVRSSATAFTSRAEFVAAGVAEVAGEIGLNSTRFLPTLVVLNCITGVSIF
jgi:hypothetical protein